MKSFIVDAFTKEPFKGNPAGVCFPDNTISEKKMQTIAMEFGLSETAFVQPTNKSNTYRIRYFSPKKEIPLCGHATLAAAKIIFKNRAINEIHFITVEKIDLLIKRKGDEITMEFPVYDTTAATVTAAMLSALGLKEIIKAVYSEKNKIIMLEIGDADMLANLKPDFTALVKSHDSINGVLVTAPSKNTEHDYHYRYFWPWAGTHEDPVTGGVQTFLSKYWAEKLGRKTMKAFQSSERTGYMNVEIQGQKVILASQAVIILEGNLVAFD